MGKYCTRTRRRRRRRRINIMLYIYLLQSNLVDSCATIARGSHGKRLYSSLRYIIVSLSLRLLPTTYLHNI